MSFPAYPEYKNSGIDWLGPVPVHWAVRRLKDSGTLLSGSGFPHEAQGQTDQRLPFYKVSDLGSASDGRHMVGAPNTISADHARRLGASIIPKGAVLWPKIGAALLLNRRRISSMECCIDNNMSAFVPNPHKMDVYWAYYWSSELDFGQFANPGAIPSLGEGYQETLPILLPPKEEQLQIINLLGHETARIDALIDEQQRLIELLKEKRQAVISHAVTKGLDPNVPMKDSGVEWLGEVPTHWGVYRIKQIADSIGGGTPAKENTEFWDGDIPWVSPKDMKDTTIWDTSIHISNKALQNTGLSLIRERALLIVVRGMILAHSLPVAINEVSVTVNQDMKALLPTRVISTDYLLILIAGIREVVFENVDESAHGTKKLDWESFERMCVPVPPPAEQDAILSKTVQEIREIDKLSNYASEAIILLSERRSTLISSAVTGKIDVRDWQPPEGGGKLRTSAHEDAEA